jgi:hypothetical protein
MSWGGPFPSLHLWPIQDTFQMKMIHLPDQQRVGFERSRADGVDQNRETNERKDYSRREECLFRLKGAV